MKSDAGTKRLERASRVVRRATSVAVIVLTAGCSAAPNQPVSRPSATTPPIIASAPNCDVRVGERQAVLQTSERRALNLTYWPDGTMGVLKDGAKYRFIAPGGALSSGSGGLNETVGSLDRPAATSVRTLIQIEALKTPYDYAAGGPVYRDPQSGRLLLFYHAENWPGGDPMRFYSVIGLATSTDGGQRWHDLGPIVAPEALLGMQPAEVASGAFLVIGTYFYVYFRDTRSSGDQINFAVARARVHDVLSAAASGKVVAWAKYYLGSWEQPGLGGRSSALESGNPVINWFDVSYNSHLRRYLMAASSWVGPGPRDLALYLLFSDDGLIWGDRRLLASESGENFYPTLVGLGEDPHETGDQFYLYYVYSASGGDRWSDAVLMRRLISC